MSTNNRHPAEAFLSCAKVRMDGDAKINVAMAVYLTLEAINASAPRGCDGMPAELMIEHGAGPVCVQDLLKKVLGFMRAPIPENPEPEFEEGFCGCGNPHPQDGWN
jgi:hypothetical protein